MRYCFYELSRVIVVIISEAVKHYTIVTLIMMWSDDSDLAFKAISRRLYLILEKQNKEKRGHQVLGSHLCKKKKKKKSEWIVFIETMEKNPATNKQEPWEKGENNYPSAPLACYSNNSIWLYL